MKIRVCLWFVQQMKARSWSQTAFPKDTAPGIVQTTAGTEQGLCSGLAGTLQSWAVAGRGSCEKKRDERISQAYAQYSLKLGFRSAKYEQTCKVRFLDSYLSIPSVQDIWIPLTSNQSVSNLFSLCSKLQNYSKWEDFFLFLPTPAPTEDSDFPPLSPQSQYRFTRFRSIFNILMSLWFCNLPWFSGYCKVNSAYLLTAETLESYHHNI